MNIEKSLRHAAHVLVSNSACLRKGSNILIICGLHNKVFAEYVALESYMMRSYPYIWVFDEVFFAKYSKKVSGEVIAVLPKHVCSLIKKSDIVIWLSQLGNIERVSTDIRKSIYSFWDAVYEVVKSKPRLLVNLPSAKYVEETGIDYDELMHDFINALEVDHQKLGQAGSEIASRLRGKSLIHVHDPNGTNLAFSIEGRYVGVETGTLEDCFLTGGECEVELPAGEVYVAPVETSANGTLVVDELREYKIRRLELCFERGRVVSFKAEKGFDVFKSILEKAEGDKDRIAELGIGTNYCIKPIGWTQYDEKALGTAHIAIGDNTNLGGVNKASIHIDFVLHNPTITANNQTIIKK